MLLDDFSLSWEICATAVKDDDEEKELFWSVETDMFSSWQSNYDWLKQQSFSVLKLKNDWV